MRKMIVEELLRTSFICSEKIQAYCRGIEGRSSLGIKRLERTVGELDDVLSEWEEAVDRAERLGFRPATHSDMWRLSKLFEELESRGVEKYEQVNMKMLEDAANTLKSRGITYTREELERTLDNFELYGSRGVGFEVLSFSIKRECIGEEPVFCDEYGDVTGSLGIFEKLYHHVEAKMNRGLSRRASKRLEPLLDKFIAGVSKALYISCKYHSVDEVYCKLKDDLVELKTRLLSGS